MAGYQSSFELQREGRVVETMRGVHILLRDNYQTYEAKIGEDQFALKFCPEFVPEFDDDSFVEWIKFVRTPYCMNVADQDLGFKVRRDHGVPVKYSATR